MSKCNRKASQENRGLTRRQVIKRAGAGLLGASVLSPLITEAFKLGRAEAGGTGLLCPLIHFHRSGGPSMFNSFPGWATDGTPLTSHFADYGLAASTTPVNTLTANGTVIGPYWNPGNPFITSMLSQFNSSSFAASKVASVPNQIVMSAQATQTGNDNTPASIVGIAPAVAKLMDQAGITAYGAHAAGLTNAPSTNGTGTWFNYNPMTRLTPQAVGDMQGLGGFCPPLSSLGASQNHFQAMVAGIQDYVQARMSDMGAAATFQSAQSSAMADLASRTVPPAALDPTQMVPTVDPNIVTMLGLTGFPNATDAILWTMIYNTLRGVFAVCGASFGGNDYHGQTPAQCASVDSHDGRIVGLAAALAAYMNKDALIVVTGDGSLQSNPATSYGPTPNGNASSPFLGDDQNYVVFLKIRVYSQGNAPKLLLPTMGNFDSTSGIVNNTTGVGTGPQAAGSVLYDWAWANKIISAQDNSAIIPILNAALNNPSQVTALLNFGTSFG